MSLTKANSRMMDIDSIYLEDFGAVADSEYNVGGVVGTATLNTENSAAIQACFDYAAANNKIVKGKGGAYYVNSTIYLKANCQLDNCQFVWSNANSDFYMFVVSASGDINPGDGVVVRNKIMRLPEVLKEKDVSTGTWSAGSHGVSIFNCLNCEFYVPKIENFNYGLFLQGKNIEGNVHNSFDLGRLSNNKVGLFLYTSATGWNNQNRFYGGQFSIYSSERHALDTAEVDTFSGNGSQTIFTLTKAVYGTAVVTVGGTPTTAFTIDNEYQELNPGATSAVIEFDSPPASGTNNIVVTYTGTVRIPGTRHIYLQKATGASYAGPNTNSFYNCSIEGEQELYAIQLAGASNNNFENLRYENGGIYGKTIKIGYGDGDYSSYNTFFYGNSQNIVNIDESDGGSRQNSFFSDFGIRAITGNTRYPVFAGGNNTAQEQPIFAAYRKEAGDPLITSSFIQDNGWITAITGHGLQHHDNRNDAYSTVAIEDDGIKLGGGANTPLKRFGGTDYAETAEINETFNGTGTVDDFTVSQRLAFVKGVRVTNWTGTLGTNWNNVDLIQQSSTNPSPSDANGANGYHFSYDRGTRTISFNPLITPPSGTNNVEIDYTNWSGTYPRVNVTYADLQLFEQNYDQNRLILNSGATGVSAYIWLSEDNVPRLATSLPTADTDGIALASEAGQDTAANIASAAATINTTRKYAGKQVWDTTNNRMMRASGRLATDVWHVIDGSASVTPV